MSKHRRKPIKFRRRHIEAIFIVGLLVWSLIWAQGFLRFFSMYLNEHPDFPVLSAWLIHQLGYLASFAALSAFATGKPMHITRFTLGMSFILVAYEISVPPLCVSLGGNLLLVSGNYSCLMGNDTVIATFFNMLGVPFGSPWLYTLTYNLGPILFGLAAVLLLSKKEMWVALVHGYFK